VTTLDKNRSNDDLIEDDYIKVERKKNVRKLISELPVKYGEALTLIYIQELSYDDASEILEISVGALKSRVLRGKKELSSLALKNMKLFI